MSQVELPDLDREWNFVVCKKVYDLNLLVQMWLLKLVIKGENVHNLQQTTLLLLQKVEIFTKTCESI